MSSRAVAPWSSSTQRVRVGFPITIRIASRSTSHSSTRDTLTMASQQLPSETDQHFIQIETPKAKANSTTIPLTVQWQNVTLKTNVKNSETKQIEEKIILNGVSGCAKPGEFVVIMGPSGAGKSSLLDCISGRKTDVEGSITVNGAPWNKKLKRLTSYVMQDDLFFATITVREHLMIQARLRMGKTHTVDEYTARVDTVIEELGLTKCRNTLIGNETIRGISGGERKRLSFATDILTNPSLLFVDEPTSGLDSFMAETVVLQLQQLARDGRTVVATIHQPSSEIFALFDKLYLLADGSTVFNGRATDSINYFASCGHQCPSFMNPTDFYMRQLVVLDKETDQVGVDRVERLKLAWKKREQQTNEALDVSPLLEVADAPLASSRIDFFGQLAVLTKRDFLRVIRDPLVFKANAFTSLFLALIVGLIYLQLDVSQKGIQNFAGVFFFMAMYQTFSSASRANLSVPLEIPLIKREYSGGLYRLFAWYLAKNISELPIQIVLPTIFFIPAYFLIGIGGGFDVFIAMLAILILTDSCGAGLGYLVSCIARRVELAPIIALMVLLPFTLFSGLLINSDDTPAYFVWIQYLSPIQYSNEAFMKIFWGQIDSVPCDEGNENCLARTGADVLRNYSMEKRSAFGNAMILLGVNLGFRLVGFIILYIALKRKSS